MRFRRFRKTIAFHCITVQEILSPTCRMTVRLNGKNKRTRVVQVLSSPQALLNFYPSPINFLNSSVVRFAIGLFMSIVPLCCISCFGENSSLHLRSRYHNDKLISPFLSRVQHLISTSF